MNLTPDTFRTVMGRFVTGVTVVTASRADQPQGISYYRRRYLRIERATSATVDGKHDG
jgi:flavin reductase (DIM6/NTAB) family NADH-FMN oxidoreductase RutF